VLNGVEIKGQTGFGCVGEGRFEFDEVAARLNAGSTFPNVILSWNTLSLWLIYSAGCFCFYYFILSPSAYFELSMKIRGASDREMLATEASESSNDAWDAVLKRDRYWDGKFVYGALATGIYCRPSCPARHPLRRNTVLFATAEEAEREGYIACGRCCPGNNSLTLAKS
jgi:hypothetical protein